ncbi:MAG: UDP-glucose 6-dehydrogenase, partial [Bacteroidetes bacterium]
KKKIENLKKGIIPIYEPGLENMVRRNVESGRLSFSTSLEESLVDCETVFIAVGTPPDEDGSADLQYVLAVADEIGSYMQDYLVIATKSTVPIKTAEKVREKISSALKLRSSKLEFDVASNPEFLKEGAAINDFLKPDRIVIGTDSKRAEKIMKRLYKPFTLNGHPIIFMDIPSAEMTKYAANSMLATKISFMNDIANLCEVVGADVNMVRKGIGSDTRIGHKFIYPGAGYGGSCFPKDVKALIRTGDEYQRSLEILKAVELVNEKQKVVIPSKLREYYGSSLKGKKIGLWGLSFKPNTDDMREAPSIRIIEELTREGVQIRAYDPVALEEAKRMLGDKIEYCTDKYEVLVDTDGLIVVTEWPEFRVLNYGVLEKLMREKVIFDGRNIYDPEELKEHGFTYYSIGRKAVKP